MSKTAFLVGEIAAAVALTAVTYGAGASIAVAELGASLGTASALFSIGVAIGITGVFGLLQPLLNPQDTSVPGSQSNAQESAAFRRVIYGVMETGGVLTFDEMPAGNGPYQNQDDGGGNSGLLNWRHQIYTVSGTEITGFGRGPMGEGEAPVTTIPMVVIDDIATELILDPGGSGYYIPADALYSPWAGNDGFHIGFEFDVGSGEGAAFPLLSEACPDWVIGLCIQQGRAKVHVAMRYDRTADGTSMGSGEPGGVSPDLQTYIPIFVQGRVPTFRFPVIGKPLLDTRIPTGGGGGGYPDPLWTANTNYPFADYIFDTSGRVEAVSVSESTGESGPGPGPPAWPSPTAFPGQTTIDNEIIWFNGGAVQPGGWPGPEQVIPYPYVFRDPNGNLELLIGFDGAPTEEAPLGTFTTGAVEPVWPTSPGLPYTTDNGHPFWLCLGAPGAFANATNPSNPALVIYDWLTNPEYGEGADPATIDIDSINAAANLCEEQVTVYIGSNGLPVTENRYNCDGVFDQGATRGDVLKSMLSSCAGTVIPPGDMWHLFAGAYNPSSFTLTDADLRAPIKADFRISRRDIANGVKGTFIPNFLPTNTTEQQPAAWRWTDFPPYQGNGLLGHPNYIAEDGGEIIWKDVRFGFTTSIWMAQRLAKITLQLLRFQVTLHIQCKLTAFPIQAGDTITFIHKRWAALASPPPTVYFVTQSTLVAESTNGAMAWGMDLVLRETDPSVYEFTAPSSSTNQGEYSQYGSLGTY
jgi:hypothetical protein